MLCFPIVVALICTARVADRDRSKQARLLFVVSLVVAMTALRDFFVVHWPESGMSSYALLPHALFLYVLVMGWILVERYTLQHRQYHELNVTLEERVAERERSLASSFEIIASQGAEKARLLERQRIMSDIHDGVGGQLVGLVNMIKRGEANQSLFDQKQLSEHAQMALDELRVAVDSMQPVDGDLATVLATLRYRLEPRLKASDIALIWRVEELPILNDLTSQKVLQIQRILLEAFTNILKHAKAHTATLSARYCANNEAIHIELTDDGIGFEADQLEAQGHGLGNMKFRAAAIGASILFERAKPQGMTLTLQLPVI
jgi:signal transduction histidine kinase